LGDANEIAINELKRVVRKGREIALDRSRVFARDRAGPARARIAGIFCKILGDFSEIGDRAFGRKLEPVSEFLEKLRPQNLGEISAQNAKRVVTRLELGGKMRVRILEFREGEPEFGLRKLADKGNLLELGPESHKGMNPFRERSRERARKMKEAVIRPEFCRNGFDC
jgi:hypothetical protein